jgi:hypothetical protein
MGGVFGLMPDKLQFVALSCYCDRLQFVGHQDSAKQSISSISGP